MADEGRTEVADHSFPEGADPKESLAYSYEIGGNEIASLKWEGFVDVAHQLGAQGVDMELVESTEAEGGIKVAVVKATVTDEDGNEWSNLGSADETANQVKDPEYTWSVAASRAIKRAIKTAFNTYPTSKAASDEPSGEPAPRGDVDGPSVPGDVELDDDHALADNADESARDVEVEGDTEW